MPPNVKLHEQSFCIVVDEFNDLLFSIIFPLKRNQANLTSEYDDSKLGEATSLVLWFQFTQVSLYSCHWSHVFTSSTKLVIQITF